MDFDSLNEEIIACRKCPRLVAWREQVARTKRRAYQDWDYWGKPVPGFGDRRARLLVIGLAPGAHGSNRTGRQFTGDGSGNFLYPALHRAGFASQPVSTSRQDGLRLQGVFITAAGRCAPPGNKPSPAELDNCQPFLEREIRWLEPKVIVVLGRIAFERVLRMYSVRGSEYTFAHGALHRLPGGAWLLCSYHPSQQNTLTGKLTARMFDEIWQKARELISHD
ncbi:MAG TPA: uracil-DNA glycosylase [Anaerolineales bacterium]|nr:uracil-DNA glycosylase [Anaerolineales bacterium]